MRRSCPHRRWRRGWNSSSLLLLLVVAGERVATGVVVGARAGTRGDTGAAAAAFGVDQGVEPAHLVLDLLEAVTLQLEGVLVHALAGAGVGLADRLEPLGEARAAQIEDPQPGLGVGLAEEREAHVEALVLPRRGTRGGERLLEELLALGGELVHDARALAREGVRRCGVRVGADDQAARDHALEGRVERSVAERPERAEQDVEPLAQLVPVHRRLLEEPEDRELEDELRKRLNVDRKSTRLNSSHVKISYAV